MKTPPFKLHFPETVASACELASDLLKSGQDFDWIAGGTDLLANYKWHINTKPHVISLSKIPSLQVLSEFEIGAMVRLSDLEDSELIHPLIKEAAGKVASRLIRQNATLGGNLCIDTRCFWFNQSEEWRASIEWCHKCDCGTGADCRVIPNQNELCVATYQGDLAPNLMVLGATVHLFGPEGERSMPLDSFFELDGITRNVLKKGELIGKVTFPENSRQYVGKYQKLRLRESWDFPEAGVAAAWIPGQSETLRVATTALESIPRMHEEEVASSNGDSVAISLAIYKNVKPVNNTFFPPRYRRSMVKVLVKRALEGY